MDRLKVVLFAANPFGDLNLDEELRRVEDKLSRADLQRIELIAVPATRPGDLIDKLNEHKPRVVQFSGHGIPTSEAPADRGTLEPVRSRDLGVPEGLHGSQIVLVGEDGKPKTVGQKGLVNLFRRHRDVVEIVVLNACYTHGQAEAIAQHVSCVIGTERSIKDEASRIFAARFYRSLADGNSVAIAFEEATIELELQGFRRPGLDPSPLSASGRRPGTGLPNGTAEPFPYLAGEPVGARL